MEGQRFFDLRRWGIAATTLNAYINGVGGGAEKVRDADYTRAAPRRLPRATRCSRSLHSDRAEPG